MLARFATLAGTFALAFGVFTGCSDSAPTSSDLTTSAVQSATDNGQSDLSGVPSFDRFMKGDVVLMSDPPTDPNDKPPAPPDGKPPRDPNDKPPTPPDGKPPRDPNDKPPTPPDGKPPRDPNDKPPTPPDGKPPRNPNDKPPVPPGDRTPKDPARKPILPGLELFQKQANLTDDQQSQLKGCLESYTACMKSANDAYSTARKKATEELNAALKELRAAVEKGSISKEDAQPKFKELTDAYRALVKSLNETFRADATACKGSLDGCVGGFLTADQLELWKKLTGNGGGIGVRK